MLVLDNGPIHTGKAATAALAARPWLTVEWLPKYAPELNDIERSWRDLKRHYLAHRTFRDADQLDRAIHQAVDALNRERRPEVCIHLRGCLDPRWPLYRNSPINPIDTRRVSG